MKILCVVEHGNAPSTRLRLRDCLDYYSGLGVEATVVPTRRSSVSERLRVLKEARRHDVVVLFKTIGFNEFELGLLHFFFQAEDGIRDLTVTGVQTCASSD